MDKKDHKNNKLIDYGYDKISCNIYKRKWYDLKVKVRESEAFLGPDEYRDLLFSSIDLRLRSDVPVGISLSGGLDSSSILSRLIDEKINLNTFSAVYGKNLRGDEKNYILEFKNSVKKMNFVQINQNDLFKTSCISFTTSGFFSESKASSKCILLASSIPIHPKAHTA